MKNWQGGREKPGGNASTDGGGWAGCLGLDKAIDKTPVCLNLDCIFFKRSGHVAAAAEIEFGKP